MRVLITGGIGFVGHHVIEHFLEKTAWEIVTLDRIDATASLGRLRHIRDWPVHASRVTFVWHDLRAAINKTVDNQIGHVDAVVHLAASTHVDRSIAEPLMFVEDNVMGTAHLLDWWRQQIENRRYALDVRYRKAKNLFINFGTDEVFGPAEPGQLFKEWDRYHSANPYSASKAGAEELACAWSNTYGLKIYATHGMNIFGERQHPEKFIPKTIGKILRGETVTIHADPEGKRSGTRFYQHAENVAAALRFLVDRGMDPKEGERLFDKWNLVGEREVENLKMAQMIAEICGKRLRAELIDARTSRPGHDFRYALDGTKLREAGLSYPMTFEQSLERTVRWFVDHPEWLSG